MALVESRTYRGDFDFGKLQPQFTEISGGIVKRIQSLSALANNYDIIHLHGFTPWIAAAIWFSPAKLVFTNHGLMGKGRQLKPHEYLKKFLLKLYLRHKVHHIVNISSYARHNLITRYRVNPVKNSIVHNCTRWQKSAIKFHPNDEITIGFHGRFVGCKRVDRLLRVAALLHKSKKCNVILLGAGPLKDEYIRQAEEMKLNVKFVDYSLNPITEMQNFDIEILPSDNEYFGVSVLESIQAGIPVFVFKDGGGCTEIFHNRFSYFICEDEQDMANKILHFVDTTNHDIKLENFRQLQEYINQNFSLEKFKNGYLRVYKKALSLL